MKPFLPQQNPEFVRQTFASIAHRYDLANHLLSLGIDFYWRRCVVETVVAHHPSRILDLATGSGDLALALRQHIPEVIGVDFSLPMLQEAKRKGMSPLLCADGMQLPFPDATFDAITIAFGLRNMASWKDAIKEAKRVLRTGGIYVVLDFSLPTSFLRGGYRFYLHKILPRIAGILTGDSDAYQYLGESIEKFPKGKAMEKLLQSQGLVPSPHRPLSGGIVTLYKATKT